MGQQVKFHILNTKDNKIQITWDDITIIAEQVLYNEGKHQMAEPQDAKAQFECCGERYVVGNTEGVSTIEDWYLGELLPKLQMLNLLKSETEI